MITKFNYNQDGFDNLIFDYAVKKSLTCKNGKIFKIDSGDLFVEPEGKELVTSVQSEEPIVILANPIFYRSNILQFESETLQENNTKTINMYVKNNILYGQYDRDVDYFYDTEKIFIFPGQYLPVVYIKDRTIAICFRTSKYFDVSALYDELVTCRNVLHTSLLDYPYSCNNDARRSLMKETKKKARQEFMKRIEQLHKWIDEIASADDIATSEQSVTYRKK